MSNLVEWIRANWLLVAFLVGLSLAFLFLRTTPTAGIETLSSLDAVLGTGQPVVLEFYSNF